MSDAEHGGREWRVLLAFAPFGLGVAWLAFQVFFRDSEIHFLLEGAGSLLLLALLVLVPPIVAGCVRRQGGKPFVPSVLSIALLAPLAVLPPWALVPTHFGPGFINFAGFIPWLTRYPTIGGVNHEVVLGALALMGACAMPAFFAAYRLFSDSPKIEVAGLLAFLCLVPWVPVFFRLDLEVLLGSLMFGGFGLLFALGGIVRILALIAVVAGLVGLGQQERARGDAVL